MERRLESVLLHNQRLVEEINVIIFAIGVIFIESQSRLPGVQCNQRGDGCDLRKQP